MDMNSIQKQGVISKQGWIMIILLFFLTVISNVDKAIIGFASVQIMDELNITPTQWGLVGSVFFWLYSLSAILMGALSDKIGAKRVITIIAIIWAVVQFSTFFVYSFPLLLATRLILGAGEGPAYSLAMTSASKWLPKQKLSFGLTLVSIGGPLGVAISAPILMYIMQSFGWRSGFIATAVVGVIWVLIWLKFSKEQPEEKASSISTPIEMDMEEREKETKFTTSLFSKNFLLIALCGFATYWSYTFGLNWLPNYLANVRQISEGQLSFAVTVPWILITLSQLFFSFLSDRLYSKTNSIIRSRVFVLGPVMILGSVCYILGTMVSSDILAVGLLSLGLTFGCITLILGPTLLVNLISKRHQGKIQGWFMAIASLGGIVGPYITGLFVGNSVSATTGFQYSFFTCAGLLFAFGVTACIGIRQKKSPVSEVSTNTAI
ncbi:MFS transporter [Peribacillus butanolivorans]|uniref:MFS transporter n=1 Tax=Peribacillus butanolivorans TaxID=421767 RepID=UPI003680AB54